MDELEKIKKEMMLKMLKSKEFEKSIFETTENEFGEKVLKKSFEKPILVDFYADWCMPCLILKPVLEKIVKEYQNKVMLAKVNVDRCPNLSKKYSIMSIPNVKLFKNGKVVGEFVGVMSEGAIRKFLEKYAGGKND